MNEVRETLYGLEIDSLERLANDYENWISGSGSYQKLYEAAKLFSRVHINHYMMWIAVEVYRELFERRNSDYEILSHSGGFGV